MQSQFDGNVDSFIEFQNAPFITWTYTDHIRKCDFVCVALPITSGSRDIKFTLSEDGMKLFVNYIWPSTLCKPFELFKDALEDEEDPMPPDHLKFHAFKSRLLELELSEKSQPRSSVVISLPVKVQRELGTYKWDAIKRGENKIVMIELKAYQKKKIIDDADTGITFD